MNFSSLKGIALFVGFVLACAVVGLWLRATYEPDWMVPDTTQSPPGLRPWAVESDCYSQLARVQRILRGQGLLQNHFTVENWPEGMDPSTTAPFDYAILVLYFPLWLFTRHPLDWAGALVSPLLWLGLVGFWTLIRSREFSAFGRAVLIAGSAAMPSIIWATAFGRPRHQSLILVLMAMGLTAEYERWQLQLAPKRAWNIFAGVVWGLACWTSLFEPAVVAGTLILFNLAVRRRENPAFLASFGIVLAAMTVLEGRHIFGNLYQISHLTPEYRTYALHWLGTISEVQPLDGVAVVQHLTLGLLLLPILAWFLWPRAGGNKTDALLILLTVLLVGLCIAQRRWEYYAALALPLRRRALLPGHPRALVAAGRARHLRRGRHRCPLRGAAVAGLPALAGDGADLPRHRPARRRPRAVVAVVRPALLLRPADRQRQLALRHKRHRRQRALLHRHVVVRRGGHPAPAPGALDRRLGRSAAPLSRAQQLPRHPRQPPLSDDDSAAAESTVAQMLIGDHLLPTWIHLRGVTPELKLYEYVPDPR
ncbi:MAG: hypothetical protein WDO13_20080 [Verrucomicrobiota bacterium]